MPTNRKKTKKPKAKKVYYLEFGSIEWDDSGTEYRPVKLNGKVVYKLDQTRYMGHLKDQSLDVCAAISQELGIEFSKVDLNNARKAGLIEV